MSSSKLQVSLATENDSKDILLWRNDKTTLLYTPSSRKISPKEHDLWFSKMLKSKNNDILIIKKASLKVGMIRFDYYKVFNEISINLNPEFRGKNLSSLSIKTGIAFLDFLDQSKKPILAKIKSNNIASIKTFEKSGFKRVKSEKLLNIFAKDLEKGWLCYIFKQT